MLFSEYEVYVELLGDFQSLIIIIFFLGKGKKEFGYLWKEKIEILECFLYGFKKEEIFIDLEIFDEIV